jgi:hypothetical protein
VGSYPTVSPLPSRRTATAVCFLLRFREVAPAWLSPAPCPGESGLSSNGANTARGRPAGSSKASIPFYVSVICRDTFSVTPPGSAMVSVTVYVPGASEALVGSEYEKRSVAAL